MAEMASLSSSSSFASVRTPTESNTKNNETLNEACSMCAFSSKGAFSEASYYCLSCSIFGRYICASCIPRHADETANHVLKYIPDYKDNIGVSTWKNAEEAKTEIKEMQKQLAEVSKQLERVNEEKCKAELDLEELNNDARSTRKDAEYAEEQLRTTEENLRRCQEEIAKTKNDLAEKDEKIKELEKTIKDLEKQKSDKSRQQKGHTDKEIVELTTKIKKLNEDKTELQSEKKILLNTVDSLNNQIKAEGHARKLVDRFKEVIGVNKTLEIKIEKLEKQLRLNTEDGGSSTKKSATNVSTGVLPIRPNRSRATKRSNPMLFKTWDP